MNKDTFTPLPDGIVRNNNGVLGRLVYNGSMFISNSRHTFVPMCCLGCQNYDPGEYSDYGSKLTPPYCEANVWFPIKKGTCKKRV